ncbi:MAG: hypothetical protein OEZ00_00625 [Dehalococcoidia bacterium]|nr:hypothetical protein [Dehalococcoidia bacterium]
MPLYEERLNANYLFIGGIFLFILAVGLVPQIVLKDIDLTKGVWLAAYLTAVTIGIIVNFLRIKIELFQDKLMIKTGLFYRKVIEVGKIQNCSPHKMLHLLRRWRNDSVWDIRKGGDRTFFITLLFVNDYIKLETAEKTFVISCRTPESFCTAIKSVRS